MRRSQVWAWAAALALVACSASDGRPSPETPRDTATDTPRSAGPEVVRGMLVLGPEVRSLKPCGEEAELWVVSTPSLQEAYDGLASDPYEPVFVELEAVREPAPATGFGVDYAAQLRVSSVRRAQPAIEGLGCREDLAGFAFRAAGAEPFWGIRVSRQAITLATPEIPSTIFAAVEPVRLDDGWRYVSQSSGPESVRMTLDLIREECSDSMVGAMYSWRATLDIGGDVRRGCAWEGLDSPEG